MIAAAALIAALAALLIVVADVLSDTTEDAATIEATPTMLAQLVRGYPVCDVRDAAEEAGMALHLAASLAAPHRYATLREYYSASMLTTLGVTHETLSDEIHDQMIARC